MDFGLYGTMNDDIVCHLTGTLAITQVLSTNLSSVDVHFTKTTLEHIERELYRHVSHLTAQQTAAATAPPLPRPTDTEPIAGPSGLAVVSIEEESSSPSGQYVTAVSVSDVELEEQTTSGLFVQPTSGCPDVEAEEQTTSGLFVQPIDGEDDNHQVLETAI